MAWAMWNGRLDRLSDTRIPADDPGFLLGHTVFETMEVRDGVIRAFELHMDRLTFSASRALLDMPDASLIRAEVLETASRVGPLCRVRVTLTGGGNRLVSAVALDSARRFRPIRAVRGRHVHEPILGGRVKHGSRAHWVVAVRNSGVDDVLMVDQDGRFTEGTTTGVWAVVDGVLWTAPDDGRILVSTGILQLLEVATAMGIPIRREGADASGPWDGLYVASATRGIAPVAELDGQALRGWEPIGMRIRDALDR